MKVYIWNNGICDSDFQPEDNVEMNSVQSYSSDAHSGGIVVLANNMKEAVQLATKNLRDSGGHEADEIDVILWELQQPSKIPTYPGQKLKRRQQAKAELLELLEQAAPEKRPVDKTSQQTDITAAHIGYNQAIDDYLANIHKLFKGEE